MSLEKIEIRNWVETQIYGIGETNSGGVPGSVYTVPPLIFNDGSVITQDGVSANGLHITSFTGLGHAPLRYVTSNSPNQDGEFVADFRLEPRQIGLNLRLDGCSRAEYWQLRNSVIDAIRPNWVRSRAIQPPPPTILGIGLADAMSRTRGDIGPHQLVIHVPQEDGSTVERAVDVRYEDGLTFEPDSNEDWDSFSIDETLTLIAHDSFLYDPVHTVLQDTQVGGSATTLGEYNGSWHAYPLIFIDMDNAAIPTAVNQVYQITIEMTFPERQSIRIAAELQAYGGAALDTSIVLDLRPSIKRAYVVDNLGGGTFPILEDITNSVDLLVANNAFTSFSIPPLGSGHGTTGINPNQFQFVTSSLNGGDVPLPWLTTEWRWHESYIGI